VSLDVTDPAVHDGEPESQPPRLPTTLRAVRALDVTFSAIALAFALFVAILADEAPFAAGGIVSVSLPLAAYAVAGLAIAAMLGQGLRVARVGQVLWSGFTLTWYALRVDALVEREGPSGALWPAFVGGIQLLMLALLFAPASAAGFRLRRED
jgi:hypothetical protein